MPYGHARRKRVKPLLHVAVLIRRSRVGIYDDGTWGFDVIVMHSLHHTVKCVTSIWTTDRFYLIRLDFYDQNA